MSVKYVEYLYGDNNSYIDTGIVVQSGYQIEVTFMSTENKLSMQKNDWSGIFGVGNLIGYSYDTAPYGISVGLYGSRVAVKNNNVTKLDYLNIDGTCYNQKYTLSLTAGENVTNPANLFLFAVNFTRNAGQSNPNSWGYSCLRVYDFKIYNAQGTLIQHLKPCLDDNNVPCMYDEVSGEYFENLGTGTFGYEGYHLYLFANNNNATAENLGSYRLYNMKIEGDSEGVESGVDYVDYIESDGASWIDTGIMTNENTQIEVTCQLVARENYRSWFGSDKVSAGWQVTDNNGMFRLQGNGAGVNAGLSTNLYGKKVWKMDTSKVVIGEKIFLATIDGVDKAEVTITKNENSTMTLKLFASHVEGDLTQQDIKYSIKGRIYDFKVHMDGQLKMHLKPCLDEEGVPCMYDEVSGEYFENLGTGTFGYKKELRDFQPVLDSNGIPTLMDKVNKKYYYDKNGNGFRYEESYKPVNYLRSDGYSWINTGIIPTTNTKVVVDTYMLLSDLNNGPALFGSTQAFLSFTFQTTVSWLYVGKINGKHSVGLAGHDFTGRHTITIDLSDMTNIVNIDGTNYGTFTGTQATDSKSIYLWNMFDSWGALGNSGGTAKIYSFKIYENNVLTMDLIPVLDKNDIPCMYDKVSQQFFYNQGTGTFSYGIEELENVLLSPYKNIEISKHIQELYGKNNSGVNHIELLPSGDFYMYTRLLDNYEIWQNRVKSGEKKPLKLKPNTAYTIYTVTEDTSRQYSSIHARWIFDALGNELFGYAYTKPYGEAHTFTTGDCGDVYLAIIYSSTIDGSNGIKPFYIYLVEGDYAEEINTNGIDYYDIATPIKYIETNGTQYIDTGVVPTDNTDIDMVASAVEGTTYKLDYFESSSGFNYLIPIHVDSFNSVITNHSDVTVRLDCYTESLDWWGIVNIASGETVDFNASYESCKHICICFQDTDIVKLNEYTFMLNNLTDSFTSNYLEDLPTCSLYLMNGLTIDTTYNFNEIDTTVEPNLTASAGATLTLGSTYSAFLTETEIEQAINNGWTIE